MHAWPQETSTGQQNHSARRYLWTWSATLAGIPSRTLLGNEQTAVYLGMPGKDTKSPGILTSLTSGRHIDEWYVVKPKLLQLRELNTLP